MLCTSCTRHIICAGLYSLDALSDFIFCKSSSQSSIVVTGVPTKSYRLPSSWIKENTTVVNVASFKNVDEDEILQIPGVSKYCAVTLFDMLVAPSLMQTIPSYFCNTAYIPMVGKVTVAMLERNLMRLFYNFHHPDRQYEDRYKAAFEAQRPAPWYGNLVQVYTALAATAILGMLVSKSK